MKCPKCQAQTRGGAQLCRACGRFLKTEITCARRGHISPQDSGFCHKYGYSQVQCTSQAFLGAPPPPSVPTSLANGRYQVKKSLGEGGKKRVYLAHETALDREAAFALSGTDRSTSLVGALPDREDTTGSVDFVI